MSNLDGAAVTRVSLTLPYGGTWSADVTIEAGKAGPSGKCSLTVGDLTLAGSVIRGGVSDGTSTWRGWIEGGAGWAADLRARSYQSDAPGGVRLATVLLDLATECGETLALPADVPIGAAYVRPGSTPLRPYTGRDALTALVARGLLARWWVDVDGTTRTTARAGGSAVATAVLSRDLSRGSRKLGAVASVKALLPGVSVDGGAIRRLYVTETAGALTAEAWLA